MHKVSALTSPTAYSSELNVQYAFIYSTAMTYPRRLGKKTLCIIKGESAPYHLAQRMAVKTHEKRGMSIYSKI